MTGAYVASIGRHGGPVRIGAGAEVAWVAAILASYLWSNDWLVAAAVAALGFFLRLFRGFSGPPVLPLALAHQWLQVTIGLFYFHVTGRALDGVRTDDVREMVLIGLIVVCSLALGVYYGARQRRNEAERPRLQSDFSSRQLLVLYLIATGITSLLLEITADSDALRGLYQGAVYLSYARLALLFLIFRRLLRPRLRLGWFVLLVVIEVGVGLTGYFAGFREILIVAALALLEVFDRRRFTHWVMGVGLVATLFITGVVWQGIKSEYRARFNEDAALAASRTQKLELVGQLAQKWAARGSSDFLRSVDITVDRLWQVYYPSLVLSRVPRVVSHTNGAFVVNAIIHVITPRFFFSDKGSLLSDSEKVRKYAGVNVAGAEEGTSIAFGYSAESYVDFGLPVMFIPIFVFGYGMGRLFRWFRQRIRHEDLATAAQTTIFWLSLYLFERSWDRSLGMSLTLVIFLGGATFALDRVLIEMHGLQRRSQVLPAVNAG